jgi:hypothetical protein
MPLAALPPPGVRVLPKEHGAWAMLLVPWAVGWGLARRFEPKELLLLVAAVGIFAAHSHLMAWRRLTLSGRSATREAVASRKLGLVFAALGALATLPLLPRGAGVVPRADVLVLLTVVAAVLAGGSFALVGRRLDRAWPGQALAATGLSLTGPAAYAVGRGALDRVAGAVWLVNATFFLWAVCYATLKIEARARRRPLGSLAAKLRCGAATIGITFATALLFAGAVVLGSLSPLALLAFVAPIVQTVAGVVRIDRPAPLRRLGILLLVHAILFGLVVIVLS